MYSEVLQDSTFDLLDAGKATFASGASITLSAERQAQVFRDTRTLSRPARAAAAGSEQPSGSDPPARPHRDQYRARSRHLRQRELDARGRHAHDERHRRLGRFRAQRVLRDLRDEIDREGRTHFEHRADGAALRSQRARCRHRRDRTRACRSARPRAARTRDERDHQNCAHPLYRDLLRDYYRDAAALGGHTPHRLDQAFSFHTRFAASGSMLP